MEQVLKNIKNKLSDEFPNTTITKGKDKRPCISHSKLSNDEINRIFVKDIAKYKENTTWGMLLGDDLMCLDFDSVEKYEEWNKLFSELSSCPLERTKKGYHCYFKNDSNYTNKTGVDVNVDLLAIENSGTRRYVVIAPSLDKEWINDFVETNVCDPSKELKVHLKNLLLTEKKPPTKFKKKDLIPFNVIRNILKSIDPKEFQNYHDWLKIVFCVKAQIPGGCDADKKIKDKYFDVIDTFCKGMTNYDQKEIIKIIFDTREPEQEYGLSTWKQIVIDYSSNPSILDIIDPISDKSAADIYIQSYGDYHLLFNFERWDYDDHNGLWRCPPKGDRKIQMRYAQQLTELREFSEEHSKMKNMLNMVDPNIKEMDLLNIIDTASLGKIQFRDCVYDMDNKRVVNHNPEFYSVKAIERNFVKKEDIPKEAFDFVDNLMNNNFDPDPDIAKQKSDYFLRLIGYAMYGMNSERRFVFGLGPSATGKGVLSELVLSTFGSYVITTDPSIYIRSDHNNSSAAKPELRRLHASRICWSQEINMTKTVDGTKIKMLVSGGDKMSCRTLHKEEVEIRINSLHFCCAQDHPDIIPLDDAVKNRIRYLRFEQVFKRPTDPTYDPNVDKLIDDTIKSKIISDDNIKQAFFWRCMEAYARYKADGSLIDPDVIKKDTERQFEDSKTWFSVFNDTFEITNDRSDIIRINEIMKIMEQENIKISQPEMKRKLKEMVGNFDGRKTTISGIQFKHHDNDLTDKDF